jgi:hypothetical protein
VSKVAGNDQVVLENAQIVGESCLIDLWYPRECQVKFLQIGLMDVRAAGDIRVSYDFQRDGWKVEQPTISEWSADDEACDQGWKEVAFIAAWHPESEEANQQ